VIIEMISPVVQKSDGKYRMSDLAWEAESWLAIRLHVTPSAAGSMRDLLAATIDGTSMDGEHIEVSAPVLQLPAFESDAYASLPVDEMVQRRLDELRFAKSSAKLRELAKAGDVEAARSLLSALEEEFGNNEWLKAKIAQLRLMTEEDMEMMSKEMQYTAYRMSSRLASKSEVAFSMDETNLNMPSFLRKKESEGRGRSKT
jgi:hypothetical protein